MMRARHLAAFLPLTLLVACATSAPPPPPDDGRAIHLEAEGDRVRATYDVDAPLDAARAVLLAFDTHKEFRPNMLESRVVEVAGTKGRVEFRIVGLLGIDPRLVCTFEVEEAERRLAVRYRMVEGSMFISEFRGSFDVRERSRDRTRIVQEVTLRAAMLGRETFAERIKNDVRAIRNRIEAVAAGTIPAPAVPEEAEDPEGR